MRRGRLIVVICIVSSTPLAGCQCNGPSPQPTPSVTPGPSEDSPIAGGGPKASPAFAPHAGAWQTKETKLLDAAKAGEVIAGTWRVSPDGQRYAYAVKADRMFLWVIDGKRLELKLTDEQDVPLNCDSPGTLTFSGDSKHYLVGASFSGNNRTRIGLFKDGMEFSREMGSYPTVWLSEDGSEYAWYSMGIPSTAYGSDTRFLYVNGGEVAQIDFGDRAGNRPTIVAGKKISWILPNVLVQTGNSRANVFKVNGKAVPLPGENLGYVLSAGGYAVVTKEDNLQFAIFNGKPQKRFASITVNSLVLSDDGKHYALVGQDAGKTYVQHDNVWHELAGTPNPGPPTSPGPDVASWPTSPLVLSPDGAHWACVVGGTAIIDGKAGKKYPSAHRLAFSLDSQHHAYVAVSSEKVKKESPPGQKDPVFEYHVYPVIVRDGVEQRIADVPHEVANSEYDLPNVAGTVASRIGPDLAFSPDSKHLLYSVVAKSGERTMLVDGVKVGQAYPAHHDKAQPSFSPDSASMAFVARQKGEWVVVLDGQERKGWDAIGIEGTRVGFTPGQSFTYLAKREGAIYWVEEYRK